MKRKKDSSANERKQFGVKNKSNTIVVVVVVVVVIEVIVAPRILSQASLQCFSDYDYDNDNDND